MTEPTLAEVRAELAAQARLIAAEYDRARLAGREDAVDHVHDAAIELVKALIEYLSAVDKPARLVPLFFHALALDPDELAAECAAHGLAVVLVQEDRSRSGYGWVVREKDTGAYFIHESLSGAVYRVWGGPR